MTNKKSLMDMPFEQKAEAPLSPQLFRVRLLRYFTGILALIALALGVGMLGYHLLENMAWVDAFLNASMILGGMGPVSELHTVSGKLFAGCYALFSGLLFLVIAALMFGPLIHRLLHRFHFEDNSESDTND